MFVERKEHLIPYVFFDLSFLKESVFMVFDFTPLFLTASFLRREKKSQTKFLEKIMEFLLFLFKKGFTTAI